MRLPGPVYIYIGLYKINSFYNCKRAFESISANLKQNMKLESYVIFFLNKKRRNLTDILDLNPFLLKTRRTFVHIYKVVQIYSDFFLGVFIGRFSACTTLVRIARISLLEREVILPQQDIGYMYLVIKGIIRCLLKQTNNIFCHWLYAISYY